MHLENSHAWEVFFKLVFYQEKTSYRISAKLLPWGQEQLNAENFHFAFPTYNVLVGPQLSALSPQIRKTEVPGGRLPALPW